MFYTNPLSVMSTGMSGQFPGLFDFASTWPGAYQALHFANGSTAVLDTYAVVTEWPWHNAKAVYESICIPSKEDSSFSESSISFAKPLPAPAAYPKPFVKDDYNLIMGFFPEGNNLDDVAVLAIPSFDTIGPLNDQYLRPDAYDNFGKVARELLLKATEKGKKKVLVDLSGNGGGTIAAGLNLFRLFFPQEEIYSATRFRANEGLDFLGEALKRIPLDSELEGSILSWRSQVRPDQDTGFSSWEDLYGPHEVLGTNSSSLFASNMSLTSTDITPISGYGNVPLNPSETLFAPEDIVLVCLLSPQQ